MFFSHANLGVCGQSEMVILAKLMVKSAQICSLIGFYLFLLWKHTLIIILTMTRWAIVFVMYMITLVAMCAGEPYCTIRNYDEHDGLSQRLVKQVVQDDNGTVAAEDQPTITSIKVID